jgi:ankyrin repeat protein
MDQATAKRAAFLQFSHLPSELQPLILAYGAAPFDTCKASAEILLDDSLLAAWVTAAADRLHSPLQQAAESHLWRICSILVRCGVFDQDGYEHSLALHTAVAAGQVEMVQELIQAGAWADPPWGGWPKSSSESDSGSGSEDESEDSEHSYGVLEELRHPLAEAAANGHADMVRLLLKQPMHPSFIGVGVCSAAEAGQLAMVKLLATERPDASSCPWLHEAPLAVAVYFRHVPIIQYFLQQGADICNLPGSSWRTCESEQPAIVAAAGSGDPDVVRLLLGSVADIHQYATQEHVLSCLSAAVRTAARFGHTQVLEVLLDGLGDHLLPRLWQGFQVAAQQGRLEAARLLLSRLPPPQPEVGLAGQLEAAPRHPLLMAAASGRADMVQMVCDTGYSYSSSVLAAAVWGVAAGNAHLPILQLLLERGADADGGLGNFVPGTPLYRAMTGSHWGAVQLLLMHGAHAGFPALMYAVNLRVPSGRIDLLLQFGASDQENQALFAAAFSGQRPTVDLLLAVSRTPSSTEAVAGRFEAALCGAASAHNLQLVQHLVTDATSRFIQQPNGPALLKQVLNRPLLAAISGVQFAMEQPCARDDGEPGRMSQHFLLKAQHRWTSDYMAIVCLLLKEGADPDHEGGRPLLLAVKRRRHDIVQALIDAGAVKIEAALSAAAGAGQVRSVHSLLSRTVSPADADGTALLAGARNGCSEILLVLLSNGANFQAALQAAQSSGDTKAADLLNLALGAASLMEEAASPMEQPCVAGVGL